MKVFRLALIAFTFSVMSITVQAQTRLMANGASVPANTQPPAATGPFAVIDSGAFTDDKTGITRVSTALRQLNAKYEPLNTELKAMQARLSTMQSDIQKKQATESQAVLAQLTDQAQQLDTQIKRKAEDGQANYQKEMAAALEPLQTDIGNALNAYAQAHAILFIIDTNRVPVIYAHDSIDITKDFIAEYNKTHPVTAAPSRP